MLSKLKSFALTGIDGYLVSVEVDISAGLPSFDLVGLADTAIKESKERVRSAIKNSGFEYPICRIVTNLAPADIKKEAPIFDVAIASAILGATAQLPVSKLKDYIFLGELSLDGSLRKINGVLPLLISARNKGYKKVIIPFDNSCEASFISGIEVYAIKDLIQLSNFIKGEEEIFSVPKGNFLEKISSVVYPNDYCYIKGQNSAKRALEIAAAGGHNVIMVGPPGSGKTMLAKAFPTILPDMTFEEALEVTKIHSISGTLDSSEGIIYSRPFRSPHHTASCASLTGGGAKSKPGEISLAHNGVLFLDEMPEYSRHTIETLRQPLEDGVITVARCAQTVEYPASFTLVASMNPCPCGYYGSKKVACKCSPSEIRRYLSKLSGPLMDRIDLHIEVDSIEYQDLTNEKLEEKSKNIKARVDQARKLQLDRFKDSKIYCNAKMTSSQVNEYCKLNDESAEILKQAFDKLNLSARAYTRILKVARTIADLEDSKDIELNHILEAIQYRSLDKKYFV